MRYFDDFVYYILYIYIYNMKEDFLLNVLYFLSINVSKCNI